MPQPKLSGDQQAKVRTVMKEYAAGQLRSGGSGNKVTNRRQAIAIALNEARRHRNRGTYRQGERR